MCVGVLEEHPHFGRRALLSTKDAHLVVDEMHLGKLGIKLLERFAQGHVERVDWAIAERSGVLDVPVDFDLHGRFGQRLDCRSRFSAMTRKPIEPKACHLLGRLGGVVHQELERSFGPLELEALRFELLQRLENLLVRGSLWSRDRRPTSLAL